MCHTTGTAMQITRIHAICHAAGAPLPSHAAKDGSRAWRWTSAWALLLAFQATTATGAMSPPVEGLVLSVSNRCVTLVEVLVRAMRAPREAKNVRSLWPGSSGEGC